jgi:glycosyltransferase involved in cell wall biosynthesis
MSTNNETKPVRVIHVVGNSRFGGAGWIILGLARMARAEGWHVDILTTDPVFQRYIRRQGFGVIELDVIRRDIRPLWDLGGLFRLRDFLRRERYDIVHTHTSKGGIVGRLAATLSGVPVIVHTVHGFGFHERSSLPALLAYSAMEKAAAPWCDRIVSVSEFHRQWALDLRICNARKIVAIPNGVADARLANAAHNHALRQQLGAGEGDLLILSMARLAEDKGFSYLLRAASTLAAGNLRFRIAIAGEGPERESLEALARNLRVDHLVTFLGFRGDVAELLAASDMVVLPSLREGLSIALLEAMSAAKPIIATTIGSHREVVSQAEVARLVPPANVKALSDAILNLAGDPAAMTRLGATARALFESRYTEARMLDSYKQLYFDLLEQKCPGQAAAAQPSPQAEPRGQIESVSPTTVSLPRQSKGGVWTEL